MVGHAGTRLLADLADVTGLIAEFGQALARLRQRRGGNDPGPVAVDVAVTIAEGGEAIAYLAVRRRVTVTRRGRHGRKGNRVRDLRNRLPPAAPPARRVEALTPFSTSCPTCRRLSAN
ncbi:hypothetical protein [Micromonospora sp. NPDC005299]|uniref:hypothetical protein n=1 Tax=Micromonospora sp. NPDC005299 TaxID=3364231 RepID=UPI003680735E